MSELRYSAANAREQARAYVAGILAALGTRNPLEVLREMPQALERAIAGLAPAELSTPEAPGKWSMCQVVQHLGDSDLVGAFRYRMVLAHDRPALAGYDQDLWVERVHRDDTDVETALLQFTAIRRANASNEPAAIRESMVVGIEVSSLLIRRRSGRVRKRG